MPQCYHVKVIGEVVAIIAITFLAQVKTGFKHAHGALARVLTWLPLIALARILGCILHSRGESIGLVGSGSSSLWLEATCRSVHRVHRPCS